LLKTLTSKFTFFFWLIFLIINILVYLFTTIFIKDILQTSEQEKVHLMINILKPTIALNISFNQDKEVDKLIETILKERNIQAISLSSSKINKKIIKDKNTLTNTSTYKTHIKDPFSAQDIATIEITYSNEPLMLIYNKIINMALLIFVIALFTFLLFYLFIKKEFTTLTYISKTLKEYSTKQKISPIVIKCNTIEITTIASAANEMMQSISQHLEELESFNTKLENQVQKKVQELQTQEKILIHQSRQAAMGEMIESIAHQWRQPLNIIGLSCANLETEFDLGIMQDKSFKEKMQIISVNINYMSNTIDDFRNFLNPNRVLTYFSPQETIKNVLSILEAQLKNNNINITLNVNSTTELYGIDNEFKQVIMILINNSKDAIKLKQEEDSLYLGEIIIDISQKNETNRISFCDNGGGIKEDNINSIFEPYFSTKFAASGTGIGLHIAKNIIETRMNGILNMKNINDGCCFTIEQNINTEKIT